MSTNGPPEGDLQLDLVAAIARIEQIHDLPEDSPLRELLIERLGTCDAPRLRRHLSDESRRELAEVYAP